MLVTRMKNDCTLVRNAVEVVKDSNVSALSKEVIFTLDEQVAETLKIDESFNFCCLH